MKHQPFFYVLHLATLLVLSGKYSVATTMICGKSEYNSNVTFTIPIDITVSGNYFRIDRESLVKKYINSYLDTSRQPSALLVPEVLLEILKARDIIERGMTN